MSDQAVILETSDGYRAAMRLVASSVVMVTTWHEGQPWGLTVSACCSVSATPPVLLVSIASHTVTAKAIRETRRFGVNVLSDKQMNVALFGARPQTPKFCQEHCVSTEVSQEAAPVISGAVAHFNCLVDQEIIANDHVIFLGAVQQVTSTDDAKPLLHFNRQFHRFVNGSQISA